MFLACFCKHQYSRGKAVAANHVPPTRRVIVTSCIIRHCMLLCSLRDVLRHGKLPHPTSTCSIYFILFYFILCYNVREQHYRHCRHVILYPSIFLHTTFFLAMGFSRLYSHVSRGCLVNIPRQNATARRSLIVLSFCKLTNIVNFILFYGAAYQALCLAPVGLCEPMMLCRSPLGASCIGPISKCFSMAPHIRSHRATSAYDPPSSTTPQMISCIKTW